MSLTIESGIQCQNCDHLKKRRRRRRRSKKTQLRRGSFEASQMLPVKG
jgi:hypothetical protein